MQYDPANEQVMPGTPSTSPAENLSMPAIMRAYRRMAPVYNWVFGPVFQEGRRSAIEALSPAPGERVLEVGVGTGITLRYWPSHARITGIDISPEMLARATEACTQHQLENVELNLMNAQAMTFPDNSFDKIAAMYVVSVAPDLPALLREIQRVCVPGGRICIVNHFAHSNRLMRYIERGLSSYAGFLGFESALAIEQITHRSSLKILDVRKVNLAGYWTLIEAENVK